MTFRVVSSIVPSVRRGSRHGFSLIEVMNFVALAAVLSAVGMYALARYVRHGKTAEAVESVARLGTRSAEYFDTSDSTQPAGASQKDVHAMRHFPPSARTPVPAEAISVRGQRYQSNGADWDGSPWKELKFFLIQPQCYQYNVQTEGTGSNAKAVVTAEGDLDGDGHRSSYTLTVETDATLAAKVGKLEKQDAEE